MVKCTEGRAGDGGNRCGEGKGASKTARFRAGARERGANEGPCLLSSFGIWVQNPGHGWIALVLQRRYDE